MTKPGKTLNVTEDMLRSYLEIFHHELKNTAEKYLPSDARQRLLHLSYLPTKIVGYVSTRHGTAFEYIPNSATVIAIVRGSLPVEDLLVHPPNGLRHIGPMFKVAARRIGMFNMTLSDAFPFRLTTREASLAIGDMTFTWKTSRREVSYAEVYGDRRAGNLVGGKGCFPRKR